MSRVHSHACIRQYVQALRPVSGGVPGAPSPAQQLLELGDALLTINGAAATCRGQGCTGVAQEVEEVEVVARVQGQERRTGETAKGY